MESDSFLPSKELVGMILRAQRPGAQRLDSSSKNCPHGKPFDLEQARFAVGEKLILAIGLLSQKYEKRIMVAAKKGGFTDELSGRLIISLGLLPEIISLKSLDLLAEEFRLWNFPRTNFGYFFDRHGNLCTEYFPPMSLRPLE